MLSHLAIALLALSPTMAGPPQVAAHGSAAVVDATQSAFLTGPATAAQCTNATVNNDQGAAFSVTRASTAYCQKDNGTYVLIDANKLVVEADGLRVEPSSTNRVSNSENVSASWTLTNLTINDAASDDPVGGSTASEFNTSLAGGLATSPAFTLAGTSAVLSAWVNNAGSGTATLILRDTTAGADRCTITVTTGTSYPSTMTGRQSCLSAAIVNGNTHVVRFYPGGVAGSNTFVKAWGIQVEPGRTIKTSYIPTSGTAVTRAADAVAMTVTDNSTAGCVAATIKTSSVSGSERIFTKGSDTISVNSTTQIFSGDGTNIVFTGGGASDITGRSVVVRAQWSGSTLSLALDSGAATGTGSFDGAMGTGATLYLGSNTGVTAFMHGWLKVIKSSTSAGGCT